MKGTPRAPRVAVAALMQESNSFAPGPCALAAFQVAGIHRGDEVLRAHEGTNTEVGGFLRVIREHGGHVVPLLSAQAISGGPLARDAYRTLAGELAERLRAAQAAAPLDGVLLALHGAMLAEGDDDPDGTTLARVREVVGPATPVAASLDLHAHVTERMVRAATALAGYNTYPHVDQGRTGERAARLLFRALRSERLAVAWRRVPLVVPAENMQTTEGPLAEVYAAAHRLVEQGRALDVTISMVQPWLDVPHLGASVLAVCGGDEGAAAGAQALVDELAAQLWARRRRFDVHLVPLEEAVDRALGAPGHPVVLSHAADGPGSGSAGDSAAVLEAFARRGLGDDGAAGRPCLFTVVDPAAAQHAIEVGAGAVVDARVGASIDPRWSRPVPLRARVAWAGQGRFTFKGPSYTGSRVHMGNTAVLSAGRLRVVVTEHAVPTIDPELYRSVGLEPREAQAVVVKSPNMFRAAYAPLAHEVLMVDAPGASSANLRALPFRRLTRPLYPWDDFEWSPRAADGTNEAIVRGAPGHRSRRGE
ncbi:MAG TPA: M81 family metallopeptidase [Longimicrobium sp.]|nr:M81 family metallopeptidase [Longimicrobium sp.]